MRSDAPITREALYLLAGPTVPEAVREEAVDRAEGNRQGLADLSGHARNGSL